MKKIEGLVPGLSRAFWGRYAALAPWVYVAIVAVMFTVAVAGGSSFGDSRAYFRAASDPALMYSNHVVDASGAYLYSPVLAQALAPLAGLGWDLFGLVWFATLAAALWWLACEWAPAILLVPVVYLWSPPPLYWPAVAELLVGNIQLLLCVALVLSFRRPALWSFALLTKPTLGVGLIWFAVRREWRNLAIAAGATMVVAGTSFVLAPGLWLDWLGVLAANAQSSSPSLYDAPFWFVPLAARLAAAGLLVAWGARTNRRWTLIVAAMLAMPVVWRTAPVMLAGLVALHRDPSASAVAGWPSWLGRLGLSSGQLRSSAPAKGILDPS